MVRRLLICAVYTCLLLCQPLGDISSLAASPDPQLPIASITLTVSEGARDELIERLSKFAEASAFATRVVHPRNEKQHYLVEFWRGDVHITVANPFRDTSDFSIFIYQTGATPVPMAHIDALIGDVQGVINKIQGITIDTIKRR
jgi:hypothetical protein